MRLFKEEKIQNELLASYVDYDPIRTKHLIEELEAGIKRSKLTQFKERLSQKDSIPAMSMGEVGRQLSVEDEQILEKIIDKIGKFNSVKLLTLLKDGITPQEQQKVFTLLMERLTEDEVIQLNDVLGRFVENN